MLLETTDLSSLAISPDGRNVAFRQEQASVEHNDYATAWLVQPLTGTAAARRVADGGEPLRYDYGGTISEPPQWSPDSRWIYYRALLQGEVQIWRAAADGSMAEQVTHDAADIDSFTLSQDGHRILYTVGATRAEIRDAEQREYDQGVRIDGTVPLGQGLVRSGYINGRLATQRWKAGWMGRGGLLADQPAHDVVLDLATGKTTVTDRASTTAVLENALPVVQVAAAPEGTIAPGILVRARESGKIAYAQQAGATMSLHVTSNASDPRSIECTATTCKDAVITGLAWRPGRDELVFTKMDYDRGHAQSLYDWDLGAGTVRPLVHAVGLIGGGRLNWPGESCAVSAEFAACVTASADEPPRLERINLETGVRTILYAPNLALAQAIGPRAVPLQWRGSHGQAFNGIFFPPVSLTAGERAPLFITYYSCAGYLRGGLGDEWPLASLAGAGIAALCIDEPRTDALQTDQAALYRTAVDGVSSVINLLAGRGLIDPKRVGMGGLSFGSEVVVWTAMKTDLLAAASVSSPSVTPTYYELHTLQSPTFESIARKVWGIGTPSETPERWREISPAFNTARIKAPLLMQIPEQEYISALDYFIPLMHSPTPVELDVFPNEPHQKFQPRHKLAAYNRNLDWFRFWLQGYVDPNPLKVPQFERWETMRSRSKARDKDPNPATTLEVRRSP